MYRFLLALALVFESGGAHAQSEETVNAFLDVVSKFGCEITDANNQQILSESNLSEQEARVVVQSLFASGGLRERNDGTVEVMAGPCS